MTEESRIPVVLLVEDDPGDVLMITEALERSGRPPVLHVAGNGHEAPDYLRRVGTHAGAVRPDLILLDLNMPRMDGREFLRRIKADPQFRAVPVVVLTTSNAEADVRGSYQGHASAFVTKPLNLDALEDVVEQISRFYTTTSILLPLEQTPAADQSGPATA
ncbi:response regulator [Kineosporia mesophila]|uniref:Response regulator n=1 Tax=Kineosporia mesophila TaxID=566012 RepID=A0ABP6ZV91_9ACTN|nr:response regulator [Kineosporia mesophila]MCD5355235.1 response regulator [Kineosporia mesophila]